VKNHPIFMTLCTQQQILNWMNVTLSKMKKLHWTDSEFDRTYFLFNNIPLPPDQHHLSGGQGEVLTVVNVMQTPTSAQLLTEQAK